MEQSERASKLRTATMLTLLVISVAAGCDRSEPRLAPLTREHLDDVKTVFNGGTGGPRMVIFFSSGCAACDTASAALNERLGRLDLSTTVLAVWEPIKPADPPPTAHMVGNLKDKRILQLWDPSHIMSDEMRAAELAHPGSPSQARTRTDSSPTGIMYDTAGLFAPSARWDATLPAPDYLEVGVEAILDDLLQRVVAMGRTK